MQRLWMEINKIPDREDIPKSLRGLICIDESSKEGRKARDFFYDALTYLGEKIEGDINDWIRDHREDIEFYINRVLEVVYPSTSRLIKDLTDTELQCLTRLVWGIMPNYIATKAYMK